MKEKINALLSGWRTRNLSPSQTVHFTITMFIALAVLVTTYLAINQRAFFSTKARERRRVNLNVGQVGYVYCLGKRLNIELNPQRTALNAYCSGSFERQDTVNLTSYERILVLRQTQSGVVYCNSKLTPNWEIANRLVSLHCSQSPVSATSDVPLSSITPISSPNVPSPTPSPAKLNKVWGAFYADVTNASQYGFNAIVTSSNLSGVGATLSRARVGGIGIIVTLGDVNECNYYSSVNTLDYQRVLADKKSALNELFQEVGGKDVLFDYARDRTLIALRVFDEVHYAGSCGSGYGVSYPQYNCKGLIRELASLPIGTDNQPGFADLLHELKKELPENVILGSTSAPSYMALVVDRVNLLRQKEGLPPLGQNSLLGYLSYQSRERTGPSSQEYYECAAIGYANASSMYFLANRTSEYETNNYYWWEDFIGACRANGVDAVLSWGWNQGSSGTFQSRIMDLADGGVGFEGQTLTLDMVQTACGK